MQLNAGLEHEKGQSLTFKVLKNPKKCLGLFEAPIKRFVKFVIETL